MIEDLKALLREAKAVVPQGNFDTGYCCCGEPMDTHGFMGNHGPVDEGRHLATNLILRIDEALAGQEDAVALSDIADLQRWTMGGHCDSFGQDCGAEMEEDDEGEYVLLADILRLKEKV